MDTKKLAELKMALSANWTAKDYKQSAEKILKGLETFYPGLETYSLGDIQRAELESAYSFRRRTK